MFVCVEHVDVDTQWHVLIQVCVFSGYDFGYMLKILTSQPLPTDESEFFDLVKMFFPNIYDVKYLMKSCKNLKGGLQEVADQLEVLYNILRCVVSDALAWALICVQETAKHI